MRLNIDGAEAEMTYSLVGQQQLIIDNTLVPDALLDRKVGERVVKQAIGNARRDGLTIIPLCPFALHPTFGSVNASLWQDQNRLAQISALDSFVSLYDGVERQYSTNLVG